MISVLVVDDDLDHTQLVRRTLERQGSFRVSTAEDGAACLAALDAGPVDLVILDYSLPRMDGLQVLGKIRALGLDVPVVMATGQGDESIAVSAMHMGAIDYIMKTSGYFATLPTVVNKVLKQHELARDNARLYAEARRQQMRLAQIFDSTSDGVVLLDGEGRVVFANRRAGELFEVDPAATAGHPLVDFAGAPLAGDDGDLEMGGGRRIVHWIAQATPDGVDGPAGRTITFQDVTREREMSRMKSEFVSFVAHQLRTPLSEIKWMLELATEEPDAPPSLRSFVQTAANAADRMLEMVRDLLDITRLESGALGGDAEPTDLVAHTRGVLQELAATIATKGHEVTVEGPATLPPVRVDPRLMREVVQNFVSNAVKYTPPVGTIAIRLAAGDGTVEWTIEDNGIGIPPAACDRLGEKFFRADNAQTVDPGGKGLGLYLARLVITRFGGQLRWASKEGGGSTFAFTLPQAEAVGG